MIVRKVVWDATSKSDFKAHNGSFAIHSVERNRNDTWDGSGCHQSGKQDHISQKKQQHNRYSQTHIDIKTKKKPKETHPNCRIEGVSPIKDN